MFQSIIEDFKRLLPKYRKQRRKSELRAWLAQKRRILKVGDVGLCSAEVVKQIAESDAFRQAATVMIYYPVQNEINLLDLYEQFGQSKRFFMPVTHRKYLEIRQYTGKDCLQKGKFGIPEPQGSTYHGSLDLIIVPAVGFDKQLYRLGRGGGYYDRFLAAQRHSVKMGVGYAFQLVDKLPHDKHDIKMDLVITAKSK